MRLPTYDEYKESGVNWLGKIPESWDIQPCRSIVRNCTDKNIGEKDKNYLSLMANVGVIRYEDKGDVGNKKPDDLTKCKVVKQGNLVINSMNYSIGSYGMSPYDGVCSPVYVVLDPDENIVERRFALRLFENRSFQKYIASFGNGILEHRAAIGWDDIKGAYIPLPPKEDQAKILSFLDRETAKIDTLIEKQQQLIKLLQEKRQAVISRAVNKGLNPNAKMKDSGVEWLGEVPEHWEVLNHRRVIATLEQGWSPQADNNQPSNMQWGVTKLSSVKSGVFHKNECKTMLDEHDPSKGLRVHNGDFLLTRANTPSLVGDVCVVSGLDQEKIILCDLIYRLKYHQSVDAHFMSLLFQSDYGRFQIMMDARGSSMTMAKISQEHIKSWLLALPPKKEQAKIAESVQDSISKLQSLIDKSLGAIDLLRERRTTLISSVVTGKIDVRNAV